MLWVPANNPPKVSSEARKDISRLLMEDGFEKTVAGGMNLVRDDCTKFGEYIMALGVQLDALSDEGNWPSRVVQAGAALALFAYRESGFYQPIDENAIAVGGLIAEIDGVPDTYLTSLALDPGIADLSAEIIDGQMITDDEGGLAQVLDIGAGCARHYLQQAIAA